MSADDDDFDLLAAEFVLGTLEGADLARATALDASDPDFAMRVVRWREHLAALDATAAPVSPSPDLWSSIEKKIDTPRGVAADEPHQPRWWNSLPFWRGLALSTSLASLLLAGGMGALWRAPPPSPTYVAVMAGDDGRAAAVVNAYADGTVELIPLAPIAVPDNRVIEVWTLQDRAQGPVSLGQLDRARRIKLDLSKLRAPDVNHLFELTLEPAGGSPTGRPTGPVLMKGLVARSI